MLHHHRIITGSRRHTHTYDLRDPVLQHHRTHTHTHTHQCSEPKSRNFAPTAERKSWHTRVLKIRPSLTHTLKSFWPEFEYSRMPTLSFSRVVRNCAILVRHTDTHPQIRRMRSVCNHQWFITPRCYNIIASSSHHHRISHTHIRRMRSVCSHHSKRLQHRRLITGNVMLPNEDFGRPSQHFTVRVRSTFSVSSPKSSTKHGKWFKWPGKKNSFKWMHFQMSPTHQKNAIVLHMARPVCLVRALWRTKKSHFQASVESGMKKRR